MLQEIDKLALIHVRERRLLAARSHGRERWYLPGGKREPGESDEQALVREVSEELGVTLDPEALVFAGVFRAQADNKPEGVLVKMTCYESQDVDDPQPHAEIAELGWIGCAQRAQCSAVVRLILDHLKTIERID
ncbi:NUDIX hydrolase [Pseudoxanthomonas composti]|uniref:NUDIX domain-containing protein n=1 Tax=Pseudoxanthomonas composti TaxID=2137479 RepID=A0A4Q1JV47_9GAMM|nr:NUDIX domain-containing protein [Pseudoxanthomonas composti]RXR06019.1 NUDIX domain-containing protein [Pseudoxanthomonas composti]